MRPYTASYVAATLYEARSRSAPSAQTAESEPFGRSLRAQVAGPIRCVWTREQHSASTWDRPEGRAVRLQVEIPPNTRSTVTVPLVGMGEGVVVTEGGVVVWTGDAFVRGARPGVEAAVAVAGGRRQAGVAFEVGSGLYTFRTNVNGGASTGSRPTP